MNSEDIKYQICKSMGDMAVSILKRKPPFDNVPMHKEAVNHLYSKLIEYSDEIDESLKRKIVECIMDKTRWYFFITMLPIKETFYEKFPQHEKTESIFREWLRKKEGDSIYRPSHTPFYQCSKLTEKIKINQIIKKVMEKEMPEFLYDKKKSWRPMLFFSKPWFFNHNIYIVIGRGTKRSFLDFFIGVSSPYLHGIDIYYTTVAAFLGSPQAVYSYDSSDGLFKAMNNGLNLIKILLPHFLGQMEKFAKIYNSQDSCL